MEHERILILETLAATRMIKGNTLNGTKSTVQIHLVLCPIKINKN